ncbi:MAG: hypothetical protein CMO98_02175 [Woeseia sp.]|nr:hypothetical protein [Woeseia sp.]
MRVFLVLSAALSICGCVQTGTEQQLLEHAISAHGGYEKLQSAATWVAEVRRYQRGDSYELRNYYRPGMVRLESDLGNGERSADVIGHPHCWGKNGPIIIACSTETRENDRPRVVMEMAAQIWPLRGDDWRLLSTATEKVDGIELATLQVYYKPLNSLAVLRFDAGIGLLHSISIDGIKDGRAGTHTHVYSAYEERCGVLMPTHNVKSFEGDIWVEEDILQMECVDVAESLFVRPEQVADGFIDERTTDEQSLVCIDQAEVEMERPVQRYIAEDGSMSTCLSSDGESPVVGDAILLPASRQLSIYGFESSAENVAQMITVLQDEATIRNYELRWPIRVITYDNDGMGPTGETVVEVTVAVFEK